MSAYSWELEISRRSDAILSGWCNDLKIWWNNLMKQPLGFSNITHSFFCSVYSVITTISVNGLIGKRILYNIPIGVKYFYSKMTMHTYEFTLILIAP